MKILKLLIVAVMLASLATMVRADGTGGPGPSTGGGGSGGGGSGGGGSDDGNGSSGGPSAAGKSQGPGGGPSGHDRREARSQNGTYSLLIGGYANGTGTATVSATNVAISGNVTLPDGSTGSFSAPSLTISGPYFSGNGTVGNQKVTVNGRVDAARASRLIATFATGDNHHGRIVGTLPTDPGDDSWETAKSAN